MSTSDVFDRPPGRFPPPARSLELVKQMRRCHPCLSGVGKQVSGHDSSVGRAHRRPRAAHIVVVSACWWGVLFPAAASAQQEPASCSSCHQEYAERLAASIHHSLLCQECHGGQPTYELATEELQRFVDTNDTPRPARPPFDHGAVFAGKPVRSDTITMCGECHANVERMNAYGLRTDQLARYQTSGHGKTLVQTDDDRVAVCVDCHGSHDVLSSREPASRTHPFNVPDTCGRCHGDPQLMAEYDLPVEVVDEYRRSVHGRMLLDEQDTGAPTCATCHGNHSAAPPGFAAVGAVCGQCHQHAADDFASSAHARLEEFKGCVQCHGGGADRHFHLIERISRPTGIMVHSYYRLLAREPDPTDERITAEIHPQPKRIMQDALETCYDCHEEIDEDESLPKLFELLEQVAGAERRFVRTAQRLDHVGRGVLLVDNQRFKFVDAKTALIGLAPLQHTLDNSRVTEKVAELTDVCNEVNTELDRLENGLAWRYRALIPMWAFALFFAAVLYVKFKQLKAAHVRPLDEHSAEG